MPLSIDTSNGCLYFPLILSRADGMRRVLSASVLCPVRLIRWSCLLQIHDFVKDIQTELDKPGVNSFGLGDFKAPKVLGDILESIAGAAFLDTALNTDQVWKVSFFHFYLTTLGITV